MFNLPFPTDSLYKFAFMFGLVLIVFSFYYKDNHLNRFDPKQDYYKADSIIANYYNTLDDSIYQKKREPVEDYSSEPTDAMHVRDEVHTFYEQLLRDSTSELIKRNQFKKEDISFKFLYDDLNDIYSRFNWKDTSIFKKVRILDSLRHIDRIYRFDEVEKFIEICHKLINADRDIGTKLRLLQDEISESNLYYKRILWAGFGLFIPGILFWYFTTQLPQDKILRLQLKQLNDTLNKSPEPPVVYGRKHFEPKILPRPEVRNRV